MLIGTKATVLTSSRHGLPLPAQRDRQPTEEERHGLVRNMIVAQYDPRWVRSHETFIEQKVMAMIKGRYAWVSLSEALLKSHASLL